MKKILVLVLLIPVIANNACSQDVVYEDKYGHVEKHDVKVTNSIVDDLNDEAGNIAKYKEKELVKKIITAKSTDGFSPGMQWKKAGKYASSFFGQWLDSWRSMNVEYFLSNYSKRFSSGGKNYSEWAKRKRSLSKNKEYIKVKATSVILLKHPHRDIMAATFFQDYRSNNFSDQSWKRQFWKKESDGRWRIVYESQIDGPYTPFLEQYDN